MHCIFQYFFLSVLWLGFVSYDFEEQEKKYGLMQFFR